MKRTKLNDTHTCDFCRKQSIKIKADWRHSGQYACDLHKKHIIVDDGYMSEADHQSWGRLFK